MSTQLPSDSELRQYAEDENAIIITAHQGTDRHMHLPDDSGENPLCNTKPSNNWVAKEPSVLPKSWWPWCSRCSSELEDMD